MDFGSVMQMIGSSGGNSGGGGLIGADPKSDSLLANTLYQSGKNRQDQVEDAQRQMGFQREMYGNRYQMQVRDLERAGLNPILAASQGAPVGGSGAMPGQPPDPGGAAKAFAAMKSASSAAAVADVQTQLLGAQRDKLEAEAGEIRARTPTYAVTIDRMRQEINQSIQTVDTLAAQAEQARSSAQAQIAFAAKLKAELPQIAQSITLMRAQTQESLQKAGLSEASAQEVMQRISAGLPQLEAFLLKMKQPEAINQAGLHSTFLGSLSTLLKGLSPLFR